MLETLLHIGRVLRTAGKMGHHRYIKPAPPSVKNSPVIYLSIPVREDFSFDFDGMSEIQDEDIIRHKLYYLAIKKSDSDSTAHYIFGDTCYGTNKKGANIGYYRMGDKDKGSWSKHSSFHRAEKDAQAFAGTVIEKFRATFRSECERIESLLKERGVEQLVFLHFDFQRQHWYEFEEEMALINRKLLGDFLDEQEGFYILKKFLYKTLASPKSDFEFPQFSRESVYKTKAFNSIDEVMDLLYAIDYSKTAVIKPTRDIKINVLPKGENIEAQQIEEFFEKKGIKEESEGESVINAYNNEPSTSDSFDSLFEPPLHEVAENITEYDFIFSKAGGKNPDIDMVEIAGIKKSFLKEISDRVNEVRYLVWEERARLYPKLSKEFIDIKQSFLNILGDLTKDKKKYQSHMLKVLPQIYTGTYYRDPILLPAFIEKTEYNIRNFEPSRQNPKYENLLKYDYYFLTRLLNRNGDQAMEEMKTSESYQAGLLLGQLAKPLDREIKSFEKNYVGLLSRRISDKQGLIKFANFINEKLAIHDVAYSNLKQAFVTLAEVISQMSEQKYNKHFCAFGFFESYFAKFEGTGKDVNPDTNNDSSNSEK